MADGWGDGEWHDMLWGGGAYPYAPALAGLAENFPIPFIATDTLSASRTATGPAMGYTATGGLVSYEATGVIED